MRRDLSEVETSVLHTDVAKLISHISPHGIFVIYGDAQLVISGTFTFDRLIELSSYLTNYGYATFRFDVQASNPALANNTYIQLTESGRLLKAIGNVPEYLLYLEELSQGKLSVENDRKRDSQRTEHLFWVNLSIALSTFVAAVYYCFQLYDGKPIAHPCIAIYTFCIAAIVAIIAVVLKVLR